jgi:hypothetical protein
MKTIDIELELKEVTGYVERYITGERKDKVLQMFESLSEKLLTAPASAHTDRHNCFPGGYVNHINRVTRYSISLYNTWKELDHALIDFTLEELVFSALMHDLGKLGSKEEDYYIPNDSDWHVKRGAVYKLNPKLSFMKVPDRSLFTLQQFGIAVTDKEYIAIKLHDGLYAKGNESYYMLNSSELTIGTNLPILLHHADHTASLSEGVHHFKPSIETNVKSKTKKINDPVTDQALLNAFDSLFGD